MLSKETEMLEKAFDILNEEYFVGALPKCTITVQSSPRAYGHFTPGKVWIDRGENYHEINISAEYLSRSYEQIFATLMHEMIHLYCAVHNMNDTSQNGRYHNKVFKTEAEKRGLHIEHEDSIGWSKTTATDAFKAVLVRRGLDVTFNLSREHRESGDTNKRGSSTRKYVCRCCGCSVRATKDVNIICGDCGITMVKSE